MSFQRLSEISSPVLITRLLCTVVGLIALSGCGSGTGTDIGIDSDTGSVTDFGTTGGLIPADINNEILRVNLDPEATYQWRVRAITDTAPGQWSSPFFVQPDADSEVLFDVSLESPETPEAVIFSDALAENASEQSISDAFYNLLFNDDQEQPPEEETRLDDESKFSGIPMFTWQQDENASAYEIEIVNADTLERLGVFQYAETSLCIEGVCELVLENLDEATLALPPIPIVEHDVVQGEAPYQLELASPVMDSLNLATYSHQWSIEGQYAQFPDAPNFQHVFSKAGSHNVNVVVTSPDGRTGYAYTTVEVSEQDMDFSGESTEPEVADLDTEDGIEPEGDSVDSTPGLSAALPETPDVIGVPDNSQSGNGDDVVELSAPVVTVRDPGPPAVIIPEEETAAPTVQEPAEEQPVGSEVIEETLPEKNESESEAVPPTEVVNVVEVESPDGNDAEPEQEKEQQQVPATEPEPEPEPEPEAEPEPEPVTTQPNLVSDIVSLEDADTLAFNNDLNMGGLFYGHPGSGWKTANGPISLQSARRFMAERSGNIIAVRHENRTLNDYNINSRCTSSAPDSVWCKCKNAGLDKYTCGYTLSNSYSVGNGGSIVVEIREDDGSDQHLPSDVVLGRTAQPYVPMETDDAYPELALEAPVALKAGKLYHLVYINVNPPTSCGIRSESVSKASSCPRNQGAISLNGVSHQVDIGPTARYGPFLSTSPAILYRSSSSSSWRISETVSSWYEVKYEDDVWVGDSMVAYDATTSVGTKTIHGSTHGRQVFTVTDTSRTVDGVWLNYGQKDYSNGEPLSVELKASDGTVLASAEIPRSEDCMPVVKNADNSFEKGCKVWGYAQFSTVTDLILGSTYSLEFSAPANAGFRISTYFTLTHYGSSDRNHWTDAHAELSTDGGVKWDPWADKFRERDIPLLFTVQGQLKQIR